MPGRDWDIDLDAIEVPDEPSVTFRLDGRTWACKDSEAIPATVVDMLGTGQVQIGPFMAAVLVPEDAEDFLALLNRPDCPLTIGRLQALIEPLSEKLLDRPTGRPALSRRGSRPTAVTSAAGRSSREQHRARSAG